MKIIAAILSSSKYNKLFISETLSPISFAKIIDLILSGILSGFQIIKPKQGHHYVRTKQNLTKTDNVSSMTISDKKLWHAFKDINFRFSETIIQNLEKIRIEDLKHTSSKDIIKILRWDEQAQDYIIPTPSKTKNQVINHILKYKSIITEAASTQKIDTSMLSSILIDEYCRLGPDDWLDWLGMLGFDTSIGLAQIKVKTAKHIITKNLYNPDRGINYNTVAGREKLVILLCHPEHSVNFCAAVIRDIINYWKPYIDLSDKTNLIGTLYSFSNPPKPHSSPRSNKRGKQIAEEFYPLSREIFR